MKSFKILAAVIVSTWAVVVATYAAQVANESKNGQSHKIIQMEAGGASCSSSSSSSGGE